MIFIKKYRYELLVFLFFAAYVLYFTTVSFLRYDNFYTGRFDLGNMSQTVWNTLHGRIFMLTNPDGVEQVSRLAVHADFILILLAPFYLIWENPKMLLLIQTLILGSGVFFVYLISKELLKNKLVSLIFAASFLLNPAVEYTNLYDFHAVTLATTFLLGAIYFILKKKYYWGLAFLVLAGFTKENIWIINALFGIYFFVFEKKKVMGLLLTAGSILLFYILVWHAIPNALGSQHFALSYYSEFGSSPSSIIKNIIFSPAKTLSDIFMPSQISYIKQLFIPFGYISLFSPFVLIAAVPSLLINLLSNNPQLHQIYYQYSADSTPFIFLSTILGVRLINKRIRAISLNALALLIIIYTFISAYVYGPLIFAKNPNNEMLTNQIQNRKNIDSELLKISENESVAVTNNLGSHLSQRTTIYTLPLGIGNADTVALLLEPNSKAADIRHSTLEPLIKKMETRADYQKTFELSNFVIFKKK